MAGFGAFGTSGLVLFTGMYPGGLRNYISITHDFFVTISVGQRFALDPSVTVCFAGEFPHLSTWKIPAQF